MKAPTEIATEFINALIEDDIDVQASEDDEEAVELDIVDIVQRSRAEGFVTGITLAMQLKGDAASLKVLENLGISEEVYMEVAELFAHDNAKRDTKLALDTEVKGSL